MPESTRTRIGFQRQVFKLRRKAVLWQHELRHVYSINICSPSCQSIRRILWSTHIVQSPPCNATDYLKLHTNFYIMEPVKTLIKLWRADKHIPDGESIKSLLPKKKEEVKSLHSLAMQPDLMSAIKLTLSTLHTAWKSLEAGLCISDDLEDPDVNQETLTTEELLIIVKVVPLFIPEEMARSLQANHIVRKGNHEGSDDECEKQKLSLEDILEMSDDDDNGTKFSSFFGSSASAQQSKRTRADSALLENSEESADEGSSESDPEPRAGKKSDSPHSVILLSAKAKNTGDDESKKENKGRTVLKPKSRARRQKSEENSAEDIKAEDEDLTPNARMGGG